MPPKAKPDTAGYIKLKKDLSAKTPGQLYVFHGEETYLRDYYLGQLRQQLLAGGMGTFNLHEISAKDMSPHALEEAVDCLPMMGERTLVQVTDFDLYKAGEKDREQYAALFAQLPDYCCVVFIYDLIPYKGDARTKMAAALKQHGTVVNFARQDQGDLVDWVRRRFRAAGKDIDSRLALDLIFLCGDLMNNLLHPSREVSKEYLVKVSNRVTDEEIRRLRAGVRLDDDRMTSPADVHLVRYETFASVLLVTIHEGRNRQVRRMFSAIGHEVVALKRVGFATIKLHDLPRGQWRRLTDVEVRKLKEL